MIESGPLRSDSRYWSGMYSSWHRQQEIGPVQRRRGIPESIFRAGGRGDTNPNPGACFTEDLQPRFFTPRSSFFIIDLVYPSLETITIFKLRFESYVSFDVDLD